MNHLIDEDYFYPSTPQQVYSNLLDFVGVFTTQLTLPCTESWNVSTQDLPVPEIACGALGFRTSDKTLHTLPIQILRNRIPQNVRDQIDTSLSPFGHTVESFIAFLRAPQEKPEDLLDLSSLWADCVEAEKNLSPEEREQLDSSLLGDSSSKPFPFFEQIEVRKVKVKTIPHAVVDFINFDDDAPF